MTASGTQPAGIEWRMTYSTSDVSSITVVAGPAASAAGKNVAWTSGAGTVTCLLYGIDSTLIASGVVAQVTLNLSPTTTSTSTAIQIVNPLAVSIGATAIPSTASGSVVTIVPPPPPALSGLTCPPAAISPGNFSCTVSLSSIAAAGGFSVSLSSSNTGVTVPGSVVIPAGSTSASLTATFSASGNSGNVVITASGGGVSLTASTAFAPAQVSSLACNPAIAPSGGSTTCTVTLVSPVPQGGAAAVSLSSGNPALTVPSSVTVPGGAASTTFAAAAAGTTVQDVTLQASVNGSSATATVEVLALEIQGSSLELSGWSNGANVTPTSAPAGFLGQLVIAGNGSVRFSPTGAPGVSFTTCCSNINLAYYKFPGVELGNMISLVRGQISFTLKSAYSFAQRQTTAAAPRYTFDVVDNTTAGHHLFYFLTEYAGGLAFAYSIGGSNQLYTVVAGTEDTLFGSGLDLDVTLSWGSGVAGLYLNGALVQSAPYTTPTAAWTANSVFYLGAKDALTAGASNSSDDAISGFTIGVPIQP